MSHPAYDPNAPLTLPLRHEFDGIRIDFMGMYDLGFPPMDDDWIIAEGHHGKEALVKAANDLHERERGRGYRPYDELAYFGQVWAINLARCPDLYTCPNKICDRYGSWQMYADWFALWTDGDEDFTADTPGVIPVTLLDPHTFSPAFIQERIEADRKWRAENPPMQL